MAQLPATTHRLNTLQRRSAAARETLGLHLELLRQRADIPSRIRGSIHQKPALWFGGSLAAGLFATSLFRRNPAPPPPKSGGERKSWFSWLLRAAISSARPILQTWLTRTLQQRVAASLQQRNTQP